MEEKHGLFLEDLAVGMTAVYAKTITEADIVMFAGISGDTNPVHLDALFADQTAFKGRIAHGMLAASFISTVLGTRLPGPGCIYLSQSLKFRAPVKIGDTVTARVTITDVNPDNKRVAFDTVCTVGDTVVIDGEAQLLVSRRAEVLGEPEAPAEPEAVARINAAE
ncbi:MAG: MaoC family dehydratase [Proteobacteria bacterium]|nr:MaoC family dehydratase [Pseudomonadota bacterium]